MFDGDGDDDDDHHMISLYDTSIIIILFIKRFKILKTKKKQNLK